MKKIYIIIICVLIAFIPTYIAVGSYLTTQVNPVKQDTVDRIVILSPDGTTSDISRENDVGGFIELAVSMNESAEKILGLPEPLLDDPYFEFTYYSFDKSSVYKYYFDKNSTDAYYVDPVGIAYHLKKESAESFLKTSYASCIFDHSSAPTLTVNSNIASPSAANWQFKGYDGTFTAANVPLGENAALETYGTPALAFDVEPDTVTLKLVNGNEVLFDGYLSELSNHDLSGKQANAHIVATWYDSAERDYRGELEYDISINFKKPPVFFISSANATTGDLVTLSVLGAEDPSKVELTIEPSLGVQPTFYADGEYARALIPVSSAVVPGTYKLSANYNKQSSTEFSLEVTSRYTASYPYNIDETLFSSLYNEANINTYDTLFDSFFASPKSVRAFDGKFISGLPNGTFESADCGDLLTISQNDVPFENPGIYYSCTKLSDVTAVNAGTVIYAGSDALAGNIVAIDHGMGLVSVYKHLGSISVKLGDELERGDIIGVSGRTGLMSKKGEHITVARIEIYVEKIPVNIDTLTANGVVFAG